MGKSHRIIEIRGIFHGLYEWGNGWTTFTANKWREYLSQKGTGIFWHYFRDENGFSGSDHLISTSANVFLHPMDFHAYIPIQGQSGQYVNGVFVEHFPIIGELVKTTAALARHCGGEMSLDLLRIHEFDDNGSCNTTDLNYEVVCAV